MSGDSKAPGATPQGGTPGAERKPLQTFALHAVFITLLLAAIPSADTIYPLAFSRVADAMAAPFARDHAVDFDWVRIGARTNRGEVVMTGSEGPPSARRSLWEIAFSITERGYTPSALFVGLMVATPMALGRHIAGIAAGLTISTALLVGQLLLLALASFQGQKPDDFGSWLLPAQPVIEAFFQSALPRYVIVLALWAVLGRPDRSLDWTPLSEQLSKLAR